MTQSERARRRSHGALAPSLERVPGFRSSRSVKFSFSRDVPMRSVAHNNKVDGAVVLDPEHRVGHGVHSVYEEKGYTPASCGCRRS